MLDTLHLDSAYLVGNSMGGMMAWGTAADHPDRIKKMVLISAAGYDMEKISDNAARTLKIPFIEYFLHKGFPLSVSEANARKVYADPFKINPESVKGNNMLWNRDGNIHAAIALAASRSYPDSAMIQTVQCPTLIIWGREDKIIPFAHAYKFERDIKGSRVIIYDNCGHCAMMEKPDETATAIKEFFGQSPVASGPKQ
jgi:pimeloyl-ACP methyl ester carboxylesterase